MRNQKATLADIAKYTNFSKTTISRYFNYPETLTPQNRAKIADALSALNYQENKVAKILANGKTEIIGVVIPNFYHQFYTSILNNLIQSYDDHGYKFIVFLGEEGCETEHRYINELLSYQIEGLIEVSHNIPSKQLKQLNIPIVGIEREDAFISSVNTNSAYGARMASEKLIEDNCEVLIHINIKTSPTVPSYAKMTGFQEICHETNIAHEIFLCSFTTNYQNNYAELNRVYQEVKKKYPLQKKGFFLSSDIYAIILENILLTNRENIPDEYEIIGFDNSPICEHALIPISSIAQNIQALTSNTIRLLVKQIQDKKKKPSSCCDTLNHIVIDPVLSNRSTTLP